ncbi:MAG: right-handed parallel beta-helix repeat-containing protein [Planctomycetota bacterium]|jgi:parallel beta-helix repeat protein|nr:right-handed parallel beta-helix repeat-containing protein [Planctomycetota bacterium]
MNMFPQTLAAILIVISLAIPAAEFVVTPDGDDGATGTAVAPLRSVAAAVERARGGDVITLRAGTYREKVVFSVKRHSGTAEQPTTLRAWPGERPILTGSDLVTGWEHHTGAIWKKTGWDVRSQQVFVDFERAPNHGLAQIGANGAHNDKFRSRDGTGLADMRPGSFHHDPEAAVLYVWLADGGDPNEHVIEASVRDAVIQTRLFEGHDRARFFRFEGLTLRHCNSSLRDQFGSMMVIGYDSIVVDCHIGYADFGGVELAGGSLIEDSVVSDNGGIGISVRGQHSGWTVRRCTVERNNHRRFWTGHHAGGLKAIPEAAGTVENSEFAFNRGSGVWFDWCHTGNPIVIRNNFIHDNYGNETDGGIKIEGTSDATISGNILARNGGNGVLVFASDRVRIAHNTLVGGRGMAAIQVGGVPREGRTTTEVSIVGNIIAGHSSTYDLLLQPDGEHLHDVRSDHNLFFRPGAGLRNSIGGTYTADMGRVVTTLDDWRQTGHDAHGLVADPLFVDPAGDNYRLTPPSPAQGAGPDGSELGALAGEASEPPIRFADPGATDGADDVWFDDHLPQGSRGGVQQIWRKDKPARYWEWRDDAVARGAVAVVVESGSRLRQVLFTDAEPFALAADEALEVQVWLDPERPPRTLAIQLGDGHTRDDDPVTTRHWPGLHWGAKPEVLNTHAAGALPEPGRWTALRVPAAALGLDGTLRRFAVSVDGGVARIDHVRRISAP